MPVTAEASVCNIALALVGEKGTIDSLEDATTAAVVCKTLWDTARRTALTEADWSFARKRAVLALSSESRDGWAYCYALPSDCLATRYLYSGLRAPAVDEMIPFSRELRTDAGGELILTDLAEATLVYSVDQRHVPLWSPLFVQALALLLASQLAMALPVKPPVGVALSDRYRVAIARAHADNLRQQREDMPPMPGGIRARGG